MSAQHPAEPREPFGEVAVPGALSGLVTRLWWLRMPSPQRFERIIPSPAVHLVVNLSEPYRTVAHGALRLDRVIEGPFVSGLQFEHLHNENPQELRHLGAELAPWALRGFGVDPRELAGRVERAEWVFGGIEAFAAHWAAHATDAAGATALGAFLVARLDAGARLDPRAPELVAALIAEPGLPIAELASRFGLSPNRLAAVMRRACGVSPKRFAELCRHHRFLAELSAATAQWRWSELAARGGYYDQPHFNREFRRFTGLTPSAFVERLAASEHGQPGFLPFDDAA